MNLLERGVRPLREGEVMALYMEFDRHAEKTLPPAEYLLRFGAVVSEATVKVNQDRSLTQPAASGEPLLQDLDRKLSMALSNTPGARLHATEAAAAITSLRAAIAAPPVAPGWMLVPTEPTPAMIEAGASDGRQVNGRPLWKLTIDVQARERYRAMLAAAPGAPDAPKE